ncbi:very short patch repair endonuclease [Sutterella sp.]|uniref:very short patch repair endonuclease n=1 Tax=Sutterella sp. TaxID=1981025 RepID=UPI0026DEEE74|nr:DNA mismatch endonuclease Vsr [Sutterella sp.]MDO5532269.1 DNA mismatch endonuclease Vsr [Sutterella sp.]
MTKHQTVDDAGAGQVDPVRSANMRAIRSKDTGPEVFVRKLLFARGFRYRLQRRDLPGTPDIVLPKYRVAVQIHGCFWHHHPGCRFAALPGTRQDFWLTKLARNVERDWENTRRLQELGWRVLIVWECACLKRHADTLAVMMAEFIRGDDGFREIGRDEVQIRTGADNAA